MNEKKLRTKTKKIKLLLTDVDGVLTDNGVYYSAAGEEMKRFSIRDGMGVERLKKICAIETGFVTGETSPSVIKRAEKLAIAELHLGIKHKMNTLTEIMQAKGLKPEEIAYIGDDVNDLDVLKQCGLSACPADAIDEVRQAVDFVCVQKGGCGAFREFAELIISLRK